jgi:predicted outer membrane protein
MFRSRLAAVLVVTTITGAAFATPPVAGQNNPSEKTGNKMSETFSVLHAVGQWSTDLSAMAEKNAKSDLVKSYAREVGSANGDLDAKLTQIANKDGVKVAPLDPKSEQGKSVLDRMKAESAMLSSLEGDAFDKEYMTLVTNTQQSVIHVLDSSRASTNDKDAKQFLDDMTTTVKGRLRTAQNVMIKVYGDKI